MTNNTILSQNNASDTTQNIYIVDYAITSIGVNVGVYEVTALAYNTTISGYQLYKTTLTPRVTDIQWEYIEYYYDQSIKPGQTYLPHFMSKSLYMSNLPYPENTKYRRLFILDLSIGQISYTASSIGSKTVGWELLALPEKEDIIKQPTAPLRLSLFISSNGYIYFSTLNKVYRSGQITPNEFSIWGIGWNTIFEEPAAIIKGSEKLLILVPASGKVSTNRFSTNIIYVSNLDNENQPNYTFSGTKYTLENKPDNQIIDVHLDDQTNRIYIISIPPNSAGALASIDILEFDNRENTFKWKYSFTNTNFSIDLVLPASQLTDLYKATNDLLGLSSIQTIFAQHYKPEKSSFTIKLSEKKMLFNNTSVIPSKDDLLLFLPHYKNLDSNFDLYLNYDGSLWYNDSQNYTADWEQLVINNPHNSNSNELDN